jgi:hypothetical protein
MRCKDSSEKKMPIPHLWGIFVFDEKKINAVRQKFKIWDKIIIKNKKNANYLVMVKFLFIFDAVIDSL